MRNIQVLLPLLIYLLLGNSGVSGYSNAPCQKSRCNNCHNQFLSKHVPPGTPTTTNPMVWEKYLREHSDCTRPTQSFLDPKDRERVDAVCSSSGGKTFKGNLCISRSKFKFLTVRSVVGTCGVSSVREELKHLILACEVLENKCVPVHFEGNRDGSTPDNNAPGCGSTETEDNNLNGKSTSFRASGIWLPSLLIIMFLSQLVF